jgi:hypothetical protein
VEEVERLVGEYNQHGEHGDVYAIDGKARRGMRKKDEEGQAYGLSIYDVQQAKVMAQVEVGRKENEIVKAPKALQLVEIAQKVITADAMHTQRGLATQILEAHGNYVFPVKENQPQLYKHSQPLFAQEYPSLALGKSRAISSPHKPWHFPCSPPLFLLIAKAIAWSWSHLRLVFRLFFG